MIFRDLKEIDTEHFWGETLFLVNHDAKTLCNLNKILGGGRYCDQRLNDFVAFDGIGEQDMRDARAFFLLQSVGDSIELVISNSERWVFLLEAGYEHLTVRQLNNWHDEET